MKSVTQLRSLRDVRTVISRHIRSTPRHKGTTYLDILSLGMESQRLETELALIDKRQRRVQARLGEIRETLERLTSEVQDGLSKAPGLQPSPNGASHAPESAEPPGGKWRELTVEY